MRDLVANAQYGEQFVFMCEHENAYPHIIHYAYNCHFVVSGRGGQVPSMDGIEPDEGLDEGK